MPEPGRDETVRVVALDKNFHMKCYKCEVSCPSCLAEVTLSLGKTKGFSNWREGRAVGLPVDVRCLCVGWAGGVGGGYSSEKPSEWS